jgi:hypothetical protein|nr:MAG TPA: Exonuclease [Caudoviricetes sp.]
MILVENIRAQAFPNNKGPKTIDEVQLEKIFNKMFYLDKNIEEETKFVKQVMTRGAETQERVGLHASAMIVSDNAFCIRQQVLSLIYKQLQGEQINVSLKRIFEEGNAIHEKWQRLFIRAGYGKAEDMDFTRMCKEYELSFTPDAIIDIPEFGKMVVEIKSVNTFQFKKMTGHPSGEKQLQFYMNRTGIHQGIVLCDDKNTQDFKIFYKKYDPNIVAPFIERCEQVQYFKQKLLDEHKIVRRCEGCNSYTCKRAESCPMKDACYNRGMGKVLNNKYSKILGRD